MPREPLKPWEPFATVVSPALGGAAPSAPTTDAHMIHGLERCIAAAHRLLDEHHDATVADRQDAEDAARLLAVLRGGATAPTPDPTATAERARIVRLMNEPHWFCAKCHTPYNSSYRAIGARCLNRECDNGREGGRETLAQWMHRDDLARLRRDTGASHE